MLNAGVKPPDLQVFFRKTVGALVTKPRNPRPKAGLTFKDVEALAAELPGVERSTSYGTPSLKVRGKMLVRLKEDGETLVIRVPFMVRDHLMKTQPRTFFITDHYAGYPAVLARLGTSDPDLIQQLIEDAWRAAAPKKLLLNFVFSDRRDTSDPLPRSRVCPCDSRPPA